MLCEAWLAVCVETGEETEVSLRWVSSLHPTREETQESVEQCEEHFSV